MSLDEAERQFLSIKRLFEAQSTYEDRFKQLKNEYEKAKIAFDIALCQMEEERNQCQEKIQILETQISSIKANLNFIHQQINWSKVCSPIDGIIIHKEIKEGTYVLSGQLLLVVASIDQFIIKMNLDEVDIAKISMDMKANVMPDAFPGETIHGIITKIAPSPILREKINTFEVTITLEKTNLPIRSEMLTDVVIISNRKTNVLKIPQEATLNIDEKNYVFVIKKNKTIKREVILGLRNPNEIEVLSGLKEGEEIVLNPPLSLKNGAKIKIKRL